MAETTGLIGWLNANAGAVTAFATLALAALTAWYVVLTRQIALASRDTVKHALEARLAAKKEALRALSPFVKRLSVMVEALPVPIQVGTVQRATIWSEDELRDLESLARGVEGADLEAASRAVKGMRFLGRVIEDILREEKGRGWNATSLSAQDWFTNVGAAREGLKTLAQSIRPSPLRGNSE